MSKTYEIQRLVTFGDTNMVKNVYFSTFFEWQGQCREEWLNVYAPDFMSQMDGNLSGITASCSCDYEEEAYAQQLVSIRMTIPTAYLNYFDMEFEYFRIEGGPERLIARGRQKVGCVRRAGKETEASPWPSEVLRGLERFDVDISHVYK